MSDCLNKDLHEKFAMIIQVKTWKYMMIMITLSVLSILSLLTVEAAPTAKSDVVTQKPGSDNSSKGANSSDSSPGIFLLSLAASKFKSFAALKNCSLAAKDEGIPNRIKGLLDGGIKLIKYHIELEDNKTVLSETAQSLVYKPLYWVRTTSRQGTGLLLLRNEFDVLSFYSLSIGVSELDVTLTETPNNCLGRLRINDVENLLRETVMNDFQNATVEKKMQPKENVCNMHVRNKDGVAEFRYYCCRRDGDGQMTCKYLYEDKWLMVLFYVIGILKIIVILYGPRFVPGSYYREKYVAAPYIHRLKGAVSDNRFEWNTVLTKYPERFRKVKQVFKLSKFRLMKQFKDTLQSLRHDVPYKLKFEDIHLKIKADRLLPEDYAPVGLMQSLYDTILKCNIRKRPALTCCNADVCSMFPFDKSFSWYRLMKEISKLVVLIALITPWIIRVAVYYQFEHTEMHLRKDAADDRALQFYFPGNFTLLLTPLHVLFILIYILLSFESCIYGVMSKRVKERFKFVLRKCFRDMRERNRGGVIGWAVKLSLQPCSRYGALGFIVGIVLWAIGFPFIMTILAFYMLPTLNITFRLLAHFIFYLVPRNVCNYLCCSRIYDFLTSLEKSFEMDEITSEESLEKNDKALKSGTGRFQQLTVITFCLISLYSIIFLLTEIVSFAVEIFIHTLMGIILNAAVTLTYVSLILLLAVYANDCFGNVTKAFLAFNKALNGLLLGLGRGKCESIMYKIEDNQENLAFRVNMEQSTVVENPIELVRDPTGYPRWRISRLLLFLSKEDIPLIPKSLYFAACKMSFYAVPGELLLRYLRAAMEFGGIIVFLLFVLVVVLAFGDTYQISTSNQLLATVAGGFVPFMLRKVVFKIHAAPGVDTSNINFQICFTHLLEKYRQSWPIHDIIVETPKRLERQQSVYFDCIPDADVFEEAGPDGGIANERLPLTDLATDAIVPPSDVEIDLLIDVNEIDADEFPRMFREPSATDMVDFA